MSETRGWHRAPQRYATALLTDLGIKRVVLVDDQAYVASKEIVKQAEVRRLGGVTWDRKGEYVEFLDDQWSKMSPAEKRKARDAAVKTKPDIAVGAIDVMRALFVGASWIAVSPQDWRSDSDACLGGHDPEATLVFFDLNLENEGGPNGGAELLGAYMERHEQGHAVLLTSTFDADEELELSEEIVEAARMPRSDLLLASKGRLRQESAGDFLDIVRTRLNLSNLQSISERVKVALAEAHRQALGELDELSLRVVEDVVVRFSRDEGSWEVDTYLRVFEIIQRTALHRRLFDRRDRELDDAIAGARRLAATFRVDHGPSHERASKLIAAENFATGEVVNRARLPVANGDVFEIAGELHVLTMQPCDLMFRDRGGSARDHIYVGRLLPVVRLAAGREPNPRQEELPRGLSRAIAGRKGDDDSGSDDATGDENEVDVADCRRPRHLSMELLDLCSFDGQGRARLDLREDDPPVPFLVPGQSRRYARLLERAGRSARSRAHSAGHGRLFIDVSGDMALRPTWRANGKALSFPLRRVARLSVPLAARVLTAFSRDASRMAFPAPLDRFREQSA